MRDLILGFFLLDAMIFLTCSLVVISFLAMSIFFYLGQATFVVLVLGLLVFNVFSAAEKEKRLSWVR